LQNVACLRITPQAGTMCHVKRTAKCNARSACDARGNLSLSHRLRSPGTILMPKSRLQRAYRMFVIPPSIRYEGQPGGVNRQCRRVTIALSPDARAGAAARRGRRGCASAIAQSSRSKCAQPPHEAAKAPSTPHAEPATYVSARHDCAAAAFAVMRSAVVCRYAAVRWRRRQT